MRLTRRLPPVLPARARAARAALTGRGVTLLPAQDAALAAVEALPAGAAGVYLHGPPGTGKTFLLDALLADLVEARRVHYARWLTDLDREVGARLGQPERFDAAVSALLAPYRVLGLDEVDVRDSDDVGMLQRTLLQAQRGGVVAVLTSNLAPDDLVAQLRVPAWGAGLVRLLAERFVVRSVDDGVDLRETQRPGAVGHGWAGSRLVDRDGLGGGVSDAGITSGGRRLPLGRRGDLLLADFRELLSTPTGRQDYLAVSRLTRTLLLRDVPPLADVDAQARQRFAVLVDVAYDTDLRLLLEAVAPDWSLLPPRTRSRLGLLR